MPTVPRDTARKHALLKAELLAAAREALAKLTDEQCETIYLELEQRLAGELSGSSVPSSISAATIGIPTPSPSQPKVAAPVDLPEARRHAAEEAERECLSRLMEQSDGTVTDAARLAGMDRSNFRRRLQRAGLRAPGKKKPGPRYTDQILEILNKHRDGLRTHEIAKKTHQAGPNAFRTLKLLEEQERVVRHGERTNTLWTLPGVVPVQRVESIGAMIVDVLAKSKGHLPIDRRFLEKAVDNILRSKGRRLKAATLMQEISRLIEKGVVAFHGANEHGPMFALALKGVPSNDLN